MPKLSIKATKFAKTPESDEIFDQVGWTSIIDQTIIPDKKRIVNKGGYNTPLIGLEWLEIKYD